MLHNSEFHQFQSYLISELSTSNFHADPNKSNSKNEQEQLNPLDPSNNEALMQMAKGNLLNYIPQTLIMGWVNYFFAGFVIMKLPFPLTDGFKQMLQQGIMTPNLNVSYVLSISWYFVNLLGLRPVYGLIMGGNEADELMKQQQQLQQMQLGGAMGGIGGPGAPKVEKVFAAEVENLQILNHESVFDGIFDRFIEKHSV